MVGFQDLAAFQQAELLGFMALQSYLKIIAKVNQKQGEPNKNWKSYALKVK